METSKTMYILVKWESILGGKCIEKFDKINRFFNCIIGQEWCKAEMKPIFPKSSFSTSTL